jgi:hypothetical protein
LKRALPLFCCLSFSRVARFQLASTVALAAAFTMSCGSGGNISGPTGPVSNGNTSVTVLLTSTANDQLSQFNIDFSSITLTSQSGKMVSLFTTPQTAEFIHLNGTAEPLVTASVPQGTYTAATATIANAGFTCVPFFQPPGFRPASLGPTAH